MVHAGVESEGALSSAVGIFMRHLVLFHVFETESHMCVIRLWCPTAHDGGGWGEVGHYSE